MALIQRAAAKNYGPAMYEIAIRQIEGRDLPKDVEHGLETMRQASVLGSPQAQFYLGNRYENGDGVPRELDRAHRYFRMCAAQGVAQCQFRIASLLFNAPDRPERDYVQAVAWFKLRRSGHRRSKRNRTKRSGQTDTGPDELDDHADGPTRVQVGGALLVSVRHFPRNCGRYQTISRRKTISSRPQQRARSWRGGQRQRRTEERYFVCAGVNASRT